MENISKVVSCFLIFLGLFIVPVIILSDLEDRITEEQITVATTKFSDNVRKHGKITQKMYNDFIDDLDASNILFDVKMVYSKDIVTPGISEPETVNGVGQNNNSSEGSSDGNSGMNENSANVSSECYYTDDIKAGIFNGADYGGDVIDGSADGEVRLNENDTFYVEVTNRTDTLGTKFRRILPLLQKDTKITANAGGLIRDEDWSDLS